MLTGNVSKMKKDSEKSDKDKKDNMLISKTEPDVATDNSKPSGSNSGSSSTSVWKKRRRKKKQCKESIGIASNEVNSSYGFVTYPPILNSNHCYLHPSYLTASSNFDSSVMMNILQITSPTVMQHRSFTEMCMFRGETQPTSSVAMSTKANNDANSSGSCSRMDISGQQNINNYRRWDYTALGKKIQSGNMDTPGLVFTLMNYNVLSQALLRTHQYLYNNHNQDALSWEKRWENLLCEISTHDADILCLQEVEAIHVDEYYSTLRNLGYEFIYKRRAPHLDDGCAIFYKTSMFNLVEYTTVEYHQNNSHVLDRDNVALIAKFSPKVDSENEFVISTTHLLYNPKRQDVRLAQTQVLLAEVDRIAYKQSKKLSNYLPIIICGDFNSEPHTAVLELITKGEVHYERLQRGTLSPTRVNSPTGPRLISPALRITDNCQHADLLPHRTAYAKIPREQEIKIIQLRNSEREQHKKTKVPNNDTQNPFSTGILSHDLKLKSVHNWSFGNDTEGTTYQNRWITVDYIFYGGQTIIKGNKTESKLQLVAKYRVPVTHELKKVKYIPNIQLGSDHLALLAKFKLDYTQKKSKI